MDIAYKIAEILFPLLLMGACFFFLGYLIGLRKGYTYGTNLAAAQFQKFFESLPWELRNELRMHLKKVVLRSVPEPGDDDETT